MTLADIIVTGLATWRISHMLVNERGPFDSLTTVRELFGIKHDWYGKPVSWPDNSIFECVWCLSVWVGCVIAALPKRLSVPFALSGVAVILEKYLVPRDD